MSLILDHTNGVRDDNRLQNLRIICPNCAATLDTHCGRKNRIRLAERSCAHCNAAFMPKYQSQRYCSRACGTRASTRKSPPKPRRKVQRPPREQLLAEIGALGYSAVGRKYGVSDNSVRKWIRAYERERALGEGRDAEIIEIPRRTWPNRRREAA